MWTKSYRALAIGLLVWTSSAHAIYREPATPAMDQSEQIPNKTIKLDSGNDTPSASPKKKTQEQRPKRTQAAQHRRPPRDNGSETPPDKGASSEAARAIGTIIGVGVGIGMGRMGGGRGDDMRMRDR